MNAVIHCAANHRSTFMATKKLFYPAAERNKGPILSVIQKYIRRDPDQVFLEISSGSGQHIAHFAPNFPQITFIPTEYDTKLLDSIGAYANEFVNIRQPLKIDITTDFCTWANGTFKEASIDYIYNANMMHITPYECSIGLFNNAGKLLKNNGILFTYGPYAIDGKITPESNVNFDKMMRLQDPRWGLRDIADLRELAEKNDIKLIAMIDMPANNKTLIWKKMLDAQE